jgi:hypothetical protein
MMTHYLYGLTFEEFDSIPADYYIVAIKVAILLYVTQAKKKSCRS